MKAKYPKFTPVELASRIDEYFIHIKGKYRMTKVAPKTEGGKPTRTKVCEREPELATISGLALFLGFSSREVFDNCMRRGKFADILKRGCLRIQAVYESRLHQHSTSGAIFALKSMGWNEKPEAKKPEETTALKTLSIKIIESGPKPVTNEKEVII
ncbi:terminase small subunit [Mucilaginibacter sp.]